MSVDVSKPDELRAEANRRQQLRAQGVRSFSAAPAHLERALLEEATGNAPVYVGIAVPFPPMPERQGADTEILRPRSIVLVAPMPSNQANRDSGQGHWRSRDRERRAYHARLDELLEQRRLPAPPASPLPFATLTSHMLLRGAMDDDNAVARHKPLLDWLVRRGYLAGDRRKHVRWTEFPEQTVSRKHEPAITLTLTPAESP